MTAAVTQELPIIMKDGSGSIMREKINYDMLTNAAQSSLCIASVFKISNRLLLGKNKSKAGQGKRKKHYLTMTGRK